MTAADRAAAREALLRLWPSVPEADRAIVRRLGQWLAEPAPDIPARQNPGRVRRDEAEAAAFDRRMRWAEAEADPAAGVEALAALRGGTNAG